jgi:uncharacterized membrane protein YqjE
VTLGAYASHTCFSDEWAWNRYYANEAIVWLESNPPDAVRFTLKKLWVTFVELRHTPYQVTATEADTEYPPRLQAAMLGWMLLARLVLLALVVRMIIDLRTGARAGPLWTLALVGAAFAPYAAVFAYQRHLIPVLIMAGGLLVFRHLFGIRASVPAVPPVVTEAAVHA